MWSFIWLGGMEAVKDGSGLLRSRLVVRRAEDSWRQGVYGVNPASGGWRNCKFAGCLFGKNMDMAGLQRR